MNKKTYHDLFWGVFFLVAAALLVASQLGWLSWHIGFWRWGFTVVLLAALVQSLGNLSVGGSVWSLAFLAIVWAKPLHLTVLVPWPILGVALLVNIGLSLLLHPFLKRHHGPTVIIKTGKAQTPPVVGSGDSVVNVTTKLGSVTRYVQTADFRLANITIGLGDAKVYFDQAEIAGDQATINIDGNMGDLELFVPANWQLDLQLTNWLGDIAYAGEPSGEPGPRVTLVGGFKLGDIKIHYI